MSTESMNCDHNLLRLSLAENLDELQEERLEHHLAQCETCQRELERLAGERDEWSQVSVALQQEAKTNTTAQPANFNVLDDGADDLLADFAVDFLSPSSAPEAIGRIGEIDVLEVIGRGGMGVVLKGYQPELKRLVAVKVLAPHLAVSGPARQRFAREAQATAAILHPNVVPILTVHSIGKLPYLVMPFLACESLQQRISRQGALDLVDVLRIGMQTAQGLAAAHAQGIVHRDVKPANILLEMGVDRVLLTDFGLARAIDDASITRSGLIAGTPQYMSPEQARGEGLDARSDLFSLGSVLYTMATGRPPFRAESTYGILRRITDSQPRPPREINSQIPVWLVAVIDRLLAKDPDKRFATAAEVAVLLEQSLAHVQQPAAVQLPEFCRGRRRWTSGISRRVAVTGGLLGVSLLAACWLQLASNRETPAVSDLPQTASPAAENNASNLQWDSVESSIDQLNQDSATLESQVNLLWDRPTISTNAEASRIKNPSPHTELLP